VITFAAVAAERPFRRKRRHATSVRERSYGCRQKGASVHDLSHYG
jgi:hypothetical protein